MAERRHHLVWMGLLLIVVGVPREALGFKPETHRDVTWAGLEPLSPEWRATLAGKSFSDDEVNRLLRNGGNAIHFNDCGFNRSFRYLGTRYRRIVKLLWPGATREEALEAAAEFGSVLHSVQDFYAHSNWVEQGFTRILDESLGHWPDLTQEPSAPPGSATALAPYRDYVLIQDGQMGAQGWRLEMKPHACIEATREGATEPLKGITTGVVGGLTIHCPVETSLGHWDYPEEAQGGLHKDEPERPCHGAAQALALEQTRHELCRLRGLLVSRYGAEDGPRALQRYWLEGTAAGTLEEFCQQAPRPAAARDPTCAPCATPGQPQQRERTYFTGSFYFDLSLSHRFRTGERWNGTVAGQLRLFERLAAGAFAGYGGDGLHGGLRLGWLHGGLFLRAGVRGETFAGDAPRKYTAGVGYSWRPVGTFPQGSWMPGLELGLEAVLDRRPSGPEGALCRRSQTSGRELCWVPELALTFEL